MGLAHGDVRDGAQGHSIYGRARGRGRRLDLGIQDRASNQDRAAEPYAREVAVRRVRQKIDRDLRDQYLQQRANMSG
jgi:hypothetical protein